MAGLGLVVSGFVLAACSGSTPSASSKSTTTTTASSTSSPAAPAGSGSATFCDVARQFSQAQTGIRQSQTAPAGGQPGQASANATALQAARSVEDDIPKLESLAPPSLQGDVQTVVNAWKPFFDAIVQASGDMTKVPASVEQNLTSIGSSPSFQALQTYEVNTCGFSPTGH